MVFIYFIGYEWIWWDVIVDVDGNQINSAQKIHGGEWTLCVQIKNRKWQKLKPYSCTKPCIKLGVLSWGVGISRISVWARLPRRGTSVVGSPLEMMVWVAELSTYRFTTIIDELSWWFGSSVLIHRLSLKLLSCFSYISTFRSNIFHGYRWLHF